MEGGALPDAALGGVVEKRRKLESAIQETIGGVSGSRDLNSFIEDSIERAGDGEWRGGEERQVRQQKERGDRRVHVALVETWSDAEGGGGGRLLARSLGIWSVHNTRNQSVSSVLLSL